MGEISSKKAVPYLISILKSDENSRVRRAARSIAQLGGKDVKEDLLKMLEDPHGEVRWTAVRALGELSDTEARPILENLAQEDPSPKVREIAGEVLERINRRQKSN